MNLRKLTDADVSDVEITSLAYDNRAVEPGALFFCAPGLKTDGHLFAEDAVRRGAAALVVERPLNLGVPEIIVGSVRTEMGLIATRFFGHPSSELELIGVTGTNGKTTTTYLIRALLEADGRQCGLLGTVEAIIGGNNQPVQRTTPEAIDLQRDLRKMVDSGDKACAIEVSSHALAQHRTEGLHFTGGVFTNLTQDHLDFHHTMEDYFQAKRLLFATNPQVAVVNIDDNYGRRLFEEDSEAVTVGVESSADYHAHNLEIALRGSKFMLDTPEGSIQIESPLPGRFNVANVLGAVAVVHQLGVSLNVIENTLPQAGNVPGRFESIDEGQDFAVLVDYAHTPDSLINVLQAARGLTNGRVICVFGCGGDRDRSKRPLMGKATAENADVLVVTSDNPRSEDPEKIIDEIVTGITGDYDRQSDRQLAINAAIREARSGDVVVIAGKGHEQGQEFASGHKVPFDDAAVVREVLKSLN